MQFNSLAFLAFFAVVFPLYCVLNFRWQNRMLLAASYLFYGWAEPRFLCLMALTTVVDFFIGMTINDAEDEGTRKRWMLISIVMNLLILGVFKYYDFFATSIAENLKLAGITVNPLLIKVGVPAGISFYTFHEISYTVDVYRKHIKAARNFEDFAVFISFFPQLVAGPIGRASWQMPQFEKPRRMTWQGWSEGALLLLFGFFKKICVADAVAPMAAKVFKNPAAFNSGMLLAGVYFFSIQIYADFSGYTDIARGLARLMGFELIENFNQPYFASNITDFWRRWHISLSTWLRDYLYIPLGGNRFGKLMQYRNLFLTMFLGGLWHGASWKFAVWGSLHGIFLAAHKFMMERGPAAQAARLADSQNVGERETHAGGTPAPQIAGGTPVPQIAGGTPAPQIAGGTPAPQIAGGTPAPQIAGGAPATRGYSLARPPMKSTGAWPVRVLKTIGTFHLVALTWIFFSAENISSAFEFLRGIFTRFGGKSAKDLRFDAAELKAAIPAVLVMILLIDLPQFLKRDHWALQKWPVAARALIYATLFVWIVMMRGLENVPFIYFQF